MNKLLTFIFILLLINITFARRRSYLSNTEPDLVFTSKGALRGTIQDTHRVFYGVPFAQPPVGEYRWVNPVDLKEWSHIRDATQQKPECAQVCTLGAGACSEIGTSEDCLYLDIFTPRNANSNSKLPVIVYIPGGAFSVGSSAVPMYDATKFANQSVVFVNINYRLGVFGFLGTETFDGNYGILDQIKALEWVNENIEAFGGNKEKVTIWGESAGAESIAIHLTSGYSKPFFHAAILSSTPLTIGLKDKTTAIGFANRFNNHLGCQNLQDLECLRGKTMEEILVAQGKVVYKLGDKILDAFTIWSPIVDGDLIPKDPLTAIKDGETHDVPTIIGDVQDEGIVFVYKAFEKTGLSGLVYGIAVDGIFKTNKEEVLKKYPSPGTLKDAKPICSLLMNDYLFHCPGRYHINKLVADHKSPVYHYLYSHPKSTGHSYAPCDGNVCHGSELTIMFGSYGLVNEDLDSSEVELSEDLVGYITNFAKTHNPNQGGYTVPVTWEPVTSTKNSTLHIEDEIQLVDKTSNNPKCDMFDKFSYSGLTRVQRSRRV